MRFIGFLLSYGLIASADGRIGDTALQFADRYGAPKDSQLTKITDKGSPLIEGAVHHTYEYQGWKIRAAFLQLGGPAVRMDFQKMTGTPTGIVIRDYELQAIAGANTPAGMSWKKTMYDNPDSPNKGFAKLAEGFIGDAAGQKKFQRTDGAILSVRSNLVVRIELPAAREHEARLKAAREQNARASVPTF